MRILTRDKARGLARGLDTSGITDEYLAFEGIISRLEQDPKVKKIGGNVFSNLQEIPRMKRIGARGLGKLYEIGREIPPRINYHITLSQNLTREEILDLIKEYGFPTPLHVGGTEDMGCTEHPLYTELTFLHQNLVFLQPYM